ncbi:MAG: class I SAM-dependent methyltransferase [Thermoguttaceae bacterium]|nr:class I SAM-dependent methyltransferase [Thermoguttaceae bacterium]
MSVTQTFYDALAPRYDKLFLDWEATTREQAALLDRLFSDAGFDRRARILDCACGIGTQIVGLAALGYDATGSDFSPGALAEAEKRAVQNRVDVRFKRADFRALSDVFAERFDIVVALDNALPHMLSENDLNAAVASIVDRIAPGGLFVASIRDYDALLATKPPYSPPYIYQTEKGRRTAFQLWSWNGDRYRLVQYLIEDEDALQISKFECEYRALRRAELSDLLRANGCAEPRWLFPEETGFYQPIVVARKSKRADV